MSPLPTLPALSPDQALLRLHRRGVPGLVLLESLGPLSDQSGLTLLSAAPVSVRHTLPERPAGGGLFPAWMGGLTYEAALAWGLPTHPPQGEAQHWGEYPSGLVWDRRAGTLELVGEAHLDWPALLSGPAPSDLDILPPEALEVGPFSRGDLDYPAGVLAVQRNILAGEVYQVNLSRGVSAAASGSPVAAYLRLRQDNPSPYMAYAELGGEVIVSCSPERLVRWQGDTVSARPIAGTRARGATAVQDAELEQELLTDPKEAAEHLMLTDLIRHDLGWLSRPGTVRVPEYRSVERYSHVMHLVSEVQGTARPGLDMAQVVRATFPGGTITGAPKRRVMQEIAALEPGPRGWYTGSLGIVSGAKAELNILIRTAVFTPIGAAAGETAWTVSVRAGAGVVMDSDPRRETRETELKAQALLEVLSGQRERQPATPSVTPGSFWSPPAVRSELSGGHAPLKVLLLDNFDSFTQNLAHDLAAHGAEVLLRSNTAPLPELLALCPDAVLIGPGPGTPQSSGVTLPLTRACLERSLPLLGVCLGHQALGEALGGRVVRAAQALHGMPETVQHSGRGLFAGVPQGAVFTRYHSLIVEGLPAQAQVTATSQAGEVMALEVCGAAAWGVQFHPESLLSEYGRTLLGNWLTLARRHQEDGHEAAAR
ncbi:chorismate-binding protein [Deinococcus altitudinis]|uniref:chorismate-binding protein n=1 Tax=Deinococcus altitudinis TaxID=468914 RepID=UPI003891CE71